MDKKKRVLIIGGSAGAAALVALIVVTIVLANRPSALIVRGLVNTISDAKRIEVFDVADDVANGGSIAVSANLDKFAKDDVTVEAKLYTDLDSLKGGYEMTVAEDDEKVLQARVLYNEDKFAFTCPELVDGAYGINYKNLEKNLPGSIFDPDEETDYSLSEEQFDYFLNLKDTAKNNKNLERDIDNMSAKYRKLIVEKLVKYAEVGRSSKTITVGGEKIPCTVISLSIDQDALALAITDVVEYAMEDKDLEKLINRVAANGSYNEEPDEIIDEFYDSLDEILDNIDTLSEEDINITLDFYITSSGRRIAQVDCEYEVDNDEMDVSIVLGKNVSTSKEISITAKDKRHNESYSIVYSVKESSSRLYESEIEISHKRDSGSSGSKEDKQKITIEWDKKTSDFELEYKNRWDEKYSIKGTLTQKGDKYIFVLTNIKSDGNAIPNVKSLELTVTIDRKDPAPSVPGGFTDITRMENREFKHLVEDINDGVQDLWDEYFD